MRIEIFFHSPIRDGKGCTEALLPGPDGAAAFRGGHLVAADAERPGQGTVFLLAVPQDGKGVALHLIGAEVGIRHGGAVGLILPPRAGVVTIEGHLRIGGRLLTVAHGIPRANDGVGGPSAPFIIVATGREEGYAQEQA